MKSVIFVVLYLSVASSLRCPSQWKSYRSNCYKSFPQSKLFWDASNFCRQQQFYSLDATQSGDNIHSELVSIHSLAENTFVYSLVPPRRTIFLGLYHKVDEGQRTWHWTDGTPFDYSRWAPNQPDPSHQKFGTMWNERFPQQWDDADWVQTGGVPFVCKVKAANCLIAPGELISDSRDCLNGGKLVGTSCECPTPYACIDCSWYNGCSSNPCQNGGTCENKDHSYSCKCVDGFTGTNCEIYKGCMQFPCLNDGDCMKHPNKSIFICTCPEDYTGVTCQTYIGHCQDEPCQNEATCHSISVSPFYVCQCKPPYVGINCTATSYDCLSNPCLNGGSCVTNDRLNKTSCLCPSTYFGTNCELQKRTETSAVVGTGGSQSNSNNNVHASFIGVTIALIAIIVILVAYIIRVRSRRYIDKDASFVRFNAE
ncbi:uncharacterized protein [Antedon mediterranea]|uniref:uncharacterized protein n=1 Tax=Antedon mediterranea TaxID=105859 RepID=UPI003AF69C25